jgi:hypothetical protein
MMMLTKINASRGQLLLMVHGNCEMITNGLMVLEKWVVNVGLAVGDTVVPVEVNQFLPKTRMAPRQQLRQKSRKYLFLSCSGVIKSLKKW